MKDSPRKSMGVTYFYNTILRGFFLYYRVNLIYVRFENVPIHICSNFPRRNYGDILDIHSSLDFSYLYLVSRSAEFADEGYEKTESGTVAELESRAVA